MLKKLSLVVAAGIAAISIVGFASNPVESSTALTEDALKQKIAQTLRFKVDEVKDTPIKGIKEVITSRGLFYVSEDGEHLIKGTLYSIGKNVANLTEQSMSAIRVDGLKKFENDMIVFKAKNEKHKVTIFTDITCGYCRKLHRQMDEYNDLGITVRYLAFPRGGIRSQSYNDLKSVWCAADPKAAMTTAKAGKGVEAAQCDKPIAEEYNFGVLAGVQGTPAIILDDGMMIPGYQEPAQLAEILKNY